jgi:hypothetical protein
MRPLFEKFIAVTLIFTHVTWMIISIFVLVWGLQYLGNIEIALNEALEKAENSLSATNEVLDNAKNIVSAFDNTLIGTSQTVSQVQGVLVNNAIPAAEFIDGGLTMVDKLKFLDGDTYEKLAPALSQINVNLNTINDTISNVKDTTIPSIGPALDEYQNTIDDSLTLITKTRSNLAWNFDIAKWILIALMGLMFFTQIPFLFIGVYGFSTTSRETQDSVEDLNPFW